MKGYGVVRTDNMAGTDVRGMLVSIEYIDNDTPTAIENGNVLKVGALIDGEREIFAGSTPAADDLINDVVLIATPEVIYDETYKSLDDFINEAGIPCRGYRFHTGDIFSVTKAALDGKETPEVGDAVELKAGTKLNVAASATAGSTQVGVIIAIDIVGQFTYYAIRVA